MNLEAGRFRHTIIIEANMGTVSDGYGATRPLWTALYTGIPAEIKPVSSRERWSGQTGKTENTHRVFMRYAPGVTTKQRIQYEGRTFNITGVIDHEERHVLLELLCVEQVS